MDLFHLLTLFFLSHGDVYYTAVPTSHVTAKPNWQTHTRPTNPTESTYSPYQSTAAVFAENWVQHMLPSCSAHPEADWARFPTGPSLPPLSFDLQDGMFTFPLFVPGKKFCDVSGSSEWRTPWNPEQRSGGWMHRWRNVQLAPRQEC